MLFRSPPQPFGSSNFMLLLAVLLASLICGGCRTTQKASTPSEREGLKRANEQALTKARTHLSEFKTGQDNRRDVERLLGRSNYRETKTINGQKETLIRYWWKAYGPAPGFEEFGSADVLEFNFDTRGILTRKAEYNVIGCLPLIAR